MYLLKLKAGWRKKRIERNSSLLLMTTIHLRHSEYVTNCSNQGLQVFIRVTILYMPTLEIKYAKVIFTNLVSKMDSKNLKLEKGRSNEKKYEFNFNVFCDYLSNFVCL